MEESLADFSILKLLMAHRKSLPVKDRCAGCAGQRFLIHRFASSECFLSKEALAFLLIDA